MEPESLPRSGGGGGRHMSSNAVVVTAGAYSYRNKNGLVRGINHTIISDSSHMVSSFRLY